MKHLASVMVYDKTSTAALEVLMTTNGILQFLYRHQHSLNKILRKNSTLPNALVTAKIINIHYIK